MITVNEVSKLAGISVRTLHYYDEIGLLHPTMVNEAGYRLYDDTALERLQDILLFRELEFPLKEIMGIIDDPSFDKKQALEDQIKLLTMKREHLEQLIEHANRIRNKEVNKMDFSAYDNKKIEEYKKAARNSWGKTEAFKEYEKKSADRTKKEEQSLAEGLMSIFTEFGAINDKNPESSDALQLVKKLQDYISENYYSCTPQILAGLGLMYVSNEEMKSNIDKAGGEGTAEFVSAAIKKYC